MKNMKLKARLIIAFSIVLFFTISIGIMGITSLQSANDRLTDFTNNALAADTAVKECRIDANIAARTIREMAIEESTANDQAYKAKIENSVNSILENIKVLKKTYARQDGLVAKYEVALNDWIAIAQKIIPTIESGDLAKAQKMIIEECSPALEGLIKIAKELDSVAEQEQSEAILQSQNSTNMMTVLMIVFLVVSVILGMIIALAGTKSIVVPLEEVRHAAERMSQGYLDTEITNHNKDEVGNLAQSMRNSMATLSSYINEIAAAMEEMANGNFDLQPSKPFVGDFKQIENSITHFRVTIIDALRSIQDSSDTVDSAAGQVSSSSQALAQGATQQASEVEHLSESINLIAEQISQTANNARGANELSSTVAKEIATSDEKMNSLIVAMGDISNTSDEISKIIKAIEDIAFQTNILALNAAVEAARAGTAGKGFAVVADEVRSLASKSSEAAKNTTQLIQSSVEAVANGTVLADDTAKAMEVVVSGAKKITDIVQKISAASDSQAESSQRITAGIDQIAAVIQTNSATAEESAAASEELTGQAQGLKTLVSRFTLPEQN